MSVGYDLRGIQSEPVQAFIRGMMDATDDVERLRSAIPDAHAHLRDLDFRTKLSDTLTLSTFHGCPPDEIERIIDCLLREVGLHRVIKLNPTLLGEAEVDRLPRRNLVLSMRGTAHRAGDGVQAIVDREHTPPSGVTVPAAGASAAASGAGGTADRIVGSLVAARSDRQIGERNV